MAVSPSEDELLPLTLKEQILAEKAKRSLYEFAKQAWHILEPSTPFSDGWHLEAIAEHLEACSNGEISNLLINVPPRHMKSMLSTVLWPVWTWIRFPEKRWLCSSYALSLAVRDSRKSKIIIESEWFRRRWGHVFQISQDQSAKMRYENNHHGYRLAVSTESAATGEGGDMVLCLSPETMITTDKGNICISEIVLNNMDVSVMSYNHITETYEWKKIEAYEKNPGRPLCRVTFSDDRCIDMTEDHPVYVVGKGYIQASKLNVNDRVITNDSALRKLQQRIGSCSFGNKESETYLLQQRLQRQRAGWRKSFQLQRGKRKGFVRGLWQRSYSPTRTYEEKYQSHLLQPCLPWNMANGRKQSCISGWISREDLRVVRETIQGQNWQEQDEKVLFSVMQSKSRQSERSNQFIRSLRGLRSESKNYCSLANRQKKVLFKSVCKYSTQRIYQRGKQPALCGWNGNGKILQRIHSSLPDCQRTRQSMLPALWNEQRRQWKRIRCASHRLRQRSQRRKQSGFSLPLVSWENAWLPRAKMELETVLVKSVRTIPATEFVYNLRIKDNRNYFAGARNKKEGGLLLHNCDDPHNVRDSYSDVKREATLLWWDVTMSTRLNNPRTGHKVIIMQRVHENDLSGHVLEQGGYTHLCLPAEFDPDRKCITEIGWEDPRKKEGELLWPKQLGKAEIERMKISLGAMGYAAQFQQTPIPIGGAIFKQEYLRYFQVDDRFFMLFSHEGGMKRVLRETCWTFATIDLAASQKNTADYTVISTFAVTPDNELLLIDQIHERLTGPEIQQYIISCYYRFGHRFLSIEAVAFQMTMVQQLLRQGIPVQEYRPMKDKVSRAISASVFYAGGMVYHLQGAAYLHILEPELLNFPKAKHDDCVDCISAACELAFQPNQPNIRFLDDEEDFEESVLRQMERGTEDWGEI